ncbi:P2Y purinoceptor 8-like [Spea bombifrons]|uniref:P2Y purinoceptor 8-like n=1 Tax=Spea bombifrons TaxID=233779 RepID=UPI0023491AEB|nr:P2Y purinoceptor 8-like [Spea bombifrons]
MTEKYILLTTEYNTTNDNTANILSNSTLQMLQSKMLQKVLPILYLAIFFFSVPVNFISTWILCKTHPWTPTVVFMINLAVTDFVYGITLPFQVVYHIRGNDWPFGSTFCTMATVLFYGNMNCSILTIASISVERYIGIVYPLRYKTFVSVQKVVLICLFNWGLVLMVEVPLIYSKLTFHVAELGIVTCFDVLPKTMFPSLIYFMVYSGCRFLLFFVIPLMVMGFCYLSIAVNILHSGNIQSQEAKKHTIYMITVLLFVFLLCYLPNNIIMIAHIVSVSKGNSLYIEYKLTLALNSLNCCMDPIVYYYGSKEFRQKVQDHLT